MEKREAYEQKVQAQLDEWKAEIDKLRAKAEAASADAQVKYLDELEELKARRRKMQERLDELSKAQGEAWQDIKSGVEAAWSDLGNAIRRAADRFG